MNPEAGPSISEYFFQEILTIYNRYSQDSEELTNKFNEDLSAAIGKLFEILKGMEDESESSSNVHEGIRMVCHCLESYEQALTPYLNRDDDRQQESQGT